MYVLKYIKIFNVVICIYKKNRQYNIV
uniref:Uncharacterized protein n=1 Tax=Anguilla anguilla TaxID=7936 RepID=A0A0E9RM51_ANGAN